MPAHRRQPTRPVHSKQSKGKKSAKAAPTRLRIPPPDRAMESRSTAMPGQFPRSDWALFSPSRLAVGTDYRRQKGNHPGNESNWVLYNAQVKNWDVIVIGGGIIGLSLSIELRKKGATVLLVERGEPGREAWHAAGGMLVDCLLETPVVLQPLATASARLYPEFAHELEVESDMKVDLRDH